MRNSFNTREKFCLNNTPTSSHFHKTLRFYFFRNFNALKRLLFTSEYSHCNCVRTINRYHSFQQIFFWICSVMKAFFLSLTSIFDSFSNLFESNYFIKTDEKLILWYISFKMLYWILIRQFNWIWIFIKRFFNFNLFDNLL